MPSLILRSSLPVNQPLTNDQMDGNFVYLNSLITALQTTVSGLQSNQGGGRREDGEGGAQTWDPELHPRGCKPTDRTTSRSSTGR